MKSIYAPFKPDGNPYVEIVQRSLHMYGIETVQLRTAFKIGGAKEIRVANFNWLENKLNRKTKVMSLLNYLLCVGIISWLKLHRVRIIFTFHNRIQHDSRHPKIDRSFMRYMCRQADAVVILSEASRRILKQYMRPGDMKKIHHISHPNYSRECGQYYKKLDVTGETVNILFAGAVKAYKGIEHILDAAERCEKEQLPVHFHICGRAADPAYKAMIEERAAQLSNVDTRLSFVPDEELYRLIGENALLVLPYNMRSSLNSGTLYLAFSLGRTAVCPKIGTVREFPEDLIYSYTYKTEDEHREKLFLMIKKACEDIKKDPAALAAKGEELKRIVETECSEEEIGRKYKELYEALAAK